MSQSETERRDGRLAGITPSSSVKERTTHLPSRNVDIEVAVSNIIIKIKPRASKGIQPSDSNRLAFILLDQAFALSQRCMLPTSRASNAITTTTVAATMPQAHIPKGGRRLNVRKALDKVCPPAKKSLISHFPFELLTIIFQFCLPPRVANSTGWDLQTRKALAALTQVCRAWRTAALAAPALFRMPPAPWKPRLRSVDAKWLSLLSLCAQSSGNTITHAVIPANLLKRINGQCIEILSRSADTLVELQARCPSPCGFGLDSVCKKLHRGRLPRLKPPAEPQLESLLGIVGRAQKLERLVLCFDLRGAFRHSSKFQLPLPLARPRDVKVTEPSYGAQESWGQHIFPFLTALCSQVERFSYKPPHPLWDTWAWSVILARAEHLRYLELDSQVWAPPAEDLPPQIDFIRLEEARLLAPLNRETPLRMPVLTAITTRACVAAMIDAPEVQRANLFVWDQSCLEALPRVLQSWPSLDCLTITIAASAHGASRLESPTLVSQALWKLMEVLTPSDHRNRKVNAPKLRHLGINYLKSFPTAPDWANKPWLPSEQLELDWEDFLLRSPPGKRSYLSYELLELVLKRERLSHRKRLSESDLSWAAKRVSAAGLRGPANPLRQPCARLESIKLAGVPVIREEWDKLLSKSDAKVTCYPDPSLAPARYRS